MSALNSTSTATATHAHARKRGKARESERWNERQKACHACSVSFAISRLGFEGKGRDGLCGVCAHRRLEAEGIP
jgi:hypothetical protein